MSQFSIEEITAMEWICHRAHTLNGVIQSLNIPESVEDLHKLTGAMLRLSEEKKKLVDEKKKATKEA